jgi:hypothetical protein
MPVGDKGRRGREITDRSVAASRLNNDEWRGEKEKKGAGGGGKGREKKAKEGIAW